VARNQTYIQGFTVAALLLLFFSFFYALSIRENIIFVRVDAAWPGDTMSPAEGLDDSSISNVWTYQRPALAALLQMLHPGNPSSILRMFDAINANPSIKYNCHEMAHVLAHRAYELYGFSDALTFDNPQSNIHTSIEEICTGGYMHGILEKAFEMQPQLAKDPGVLCEGIPVKNQPDCYHGVGHALMFVNNRKIGVSLTQCTSLGTTAARNCYQGVWMELFIGNTDHSGQGTLYWDVANPLDQCLPTSGEIRNQCFFYLGLGYVHIHQSDYGGAIHLCLTSTLSEADTRYCLQGVATHIVGYFRGSHLEQVVPYISDLDEAQKKTFYNGLMYYAYFAKINTDTLSNTCDLLNSDRAMCHSALDLAITLLGR
jgi:hypothetical protein